MKSKSIFAMPYLIMLFFSPSCKESNDNFPREAQIVDQPTNAEASDTVTSTINEVQNSAITSIDKYLFEVDSLRWINYDYLYYKKLVNASLKKNGR